MKEFVKKLMYIVVCECLFWGIGLPALQISAVETIAIYVSAEGNDAALGTKNAPLKTLEAARDRVREINDGTFDIIVYLREGVYNRSETFLLTEEDSGKDGHTVTYQAYEDEQVTITGGVDIPESACQKVTDPNALKKIDPEIIDDVIQINLKDLGFTEFSPPPLTASTGILPWMTKEPNGAELFFDDEAMTIARWPNNGEWALTGEITDPGAHPRLWQDDEKEGGNWIPPEERDPEHGFTMKYTDSRVEKWVDEKNALMCGFWWWDWYDQIVRIKSISTNSRTITSEQPSMYMARSGQKYYAYNILSELDAPGEYYLDIDQGILFFYPPEGGKGHTMGYTAMTEPIVKMENTSNIIIKDLDFELTRGDTIVATNAQNNKVYGCTIRNTAGVAIDLEGKNNGVQYCTIYNVNGGVSLTGGDRNTLEPGENYVENCEIYRFARITQSYTNAISLNGVGNRASNNEMYDALHQAMSFSGNDHLMENNDIHDVLLNTDDAGAVYTGRNFTMRGNVLKNNFIHHLGSYSTLEGAREESSGTGAMGIYLDDGFAGTTMVNNIFYKTDRGIMLNGGSASVITGNAMLDVPVPILVSAAAADPQGDGTWELNGYGLYKDFTKEPLVPFRSEVYSKYPYMNNIENDEPRKPKHNLIQDNVSGVTNVVSGYYAPLSESEYKTMNDVEYASAAIISEKDFVDVAGGDFTFTQSLIERVPALADTDFSAIGIRPRPQEESVSTVEITALGGTGVNIGGGMDTPGAGVSGSTLVMLAGSPKAIAGGTDTYVDRKNTSVTPVVIEDRTYAPVRFVAETFGAEVVWSEQDGSVTLRFNGNDIVLVPEIAQMTVAGESIALDGAPFVSADRMFVPLRAVVEAAGKTVFYERGLIVIGDGDVGGELSRNQITRLIDDLEI